MTCLHDLLCQILGFRYTAEVTEPVEPRSLPKPPANLGFSGAGIRSTLLDTPGQLRIIWVLRRLRCHRRSLHDFFL
jgi:hypothetical protein